MPQFKNKISRAIYYKKREKELKKQQKKIDKEIEKEYREKYPKDHSNISNKLARKMANFFDILWPDDEEQIDKEYMDMLSDAEKKELGLMKTENKRVLTIASIIMSSALTIACIVVYVAVMLNKSHYEKVIKPMINNYYQFHYFKEIQVLSHEDICYEVMDEKHSRKEECTNLHLSYINDGTHVITINDEYIGDDVNQNSFKESYKAKIENRFSYLGIVDQDVTLSYKDLYHDYYLYEDYSKILPVGKNFDELLNSRKLTISNVILYKNELNINDMQNYIKNFSDDSAIYLIKVSAGLPSNLTIIKKDYVFDSSVSNSTPLKENITNYELDRNVNSINDISVKDVSTHGINNIYSDYDDKKTYQYNDGIYISTEYERAWGDEPQKPHYYLIKFTNGSYKYNNLALFDGSNGRYSEMEKKEYPFYITLTIGNDTYLIGDDSLGIANKTKKKSGFLCNLGLC